MDRLLETGYDFVLADYATVSGTNLLDNTPHLFQPVSDALATSRQSGFAASRVDVVGHGGGGLLARLHAQQHAIQNENYYLGDVHKLITLGTPHSGSYLMGLVSALKTNDPVTFAKVRSLVLSASEISGAILPVDLGHAVVSDQTTGSPLLNELEELPVPSHAIATASTTPGPGTVPALLHELLGVPTQGDGFSSVESAFGGIASNAVTVVANVAHSWQPTDTNVAALILSLLEEPVTWSNRFGFFPTSPGATATNPPAVPGVTN